MAKRIGQAPNSEKTSLAGTEKFPIDNSQYVQIDTVKDYVVGFVKKRFTVRAATTANITIATALNNGDTLDGEPVPGRVIVPFRMLPIFLASSDKLSAYISAPTSIERNFSMSEMRLIKLFVIAISSDGEGVQMVVVEPPPPSSLSIAML